MIIIKQKIKVMLAMRQMTMKKLADRMTEVTGKNYTAAMLYGKINRDTISFTEIQFIAQILDYEVDINEKK